MRTDTANACTHPLAFVRAQRGWSYQRLARVVARRARDLGVANMAAERQKVWRWEHRGVVPDRVSQLALAAELGVPSEKVESHPWPAWLPTGDAVRVDYPWNPSGAITALLDVVDNAMMDRRGFLTISGDGVAALSSSWLALEPARLTDALAGGRVDAQIVSQIEHSVPGLRQMDERLGGEGVRRLVDAELGVVTDLLAHGSYGERLGQRLHATAAELARVAGWVSFDAGFHTAAQRYWVTALHAAHAADERIIGANVFKNMALQCVDFGRPREALELADGAIASVGGISGRVRGMLEMRLARAHAALGNAADCSRAIANSEKAMTHASKEDPSWSIWFDESEFRAQVGLCYTDLGNLRQADDWLASALERHPKSRVRDRATYLLRRASVCVDLGKLDEGCLLAKEAVPLLGGTRSRRNANRAGELRRRLRRWPGDAIAREVDRLLSEGG
jgi:hypothetical protein